MRFLDSHSPLMLEILAKRPKCEITQSFIDLGHTWHAKRTSATLEPIKLHVIYLVKYTEILSSNFQSISEECCFLMISSGR